MINRWSLLMVTVASLVFANDLRGDAGPAFLRPAKLNISLRFENLEEFPNFDFYLREVHGERTFHLLKMDRVAILTGPSGSGPGKVHLVAVPKSQAMPSELEFDKEKSPHLLQSKPLHGPNGEINRGDNGCTLRYDVRIEGETLAVEFRDAYCPQNLEMWKGIATAALLVAVIVIVIRYRRASAKPPVVE